MGKREEMEKGGQKKMEMQSRQRKRVTDRGKRIEDRAVSL